MKIEMTNKDGVTLLTAGKYCTEDIEVVPAFTIGEENIVAQVVDRTVTKITALDLAGATKIGDYAFRACDSLTWIQIPNSVTKIGAYAFYGCYKISNPYIQLDNITEIGGSAFYSFGNSSSRNENNIIELNFEKSSFSSINSSCFYSLRYMVLRFPKTLKTVGSSGISASNSIIYFNSESPPTLSSSLSSSSKYFVPYNSLNAYKTPNYWNAVESLIIGYAPANTFTNGQNLPDYNAEGYSLIWYNDKSLSTSVTEVNNEELEYYCTLGDKIGGVLSIGDFNNSIITVTDGTTNYVNGDLIPLGTTITITATVIDSSAQNENIFVNGNLFSSGDSITVEDNISINTYTEGQKVARISAISYIYFQNKNYTKLTVNSVKNLYVGMKVKFVTQSGYVITSAGIRQIIYIEGDSICAVSGSEFTSSLVPLGSYLLFTTDEATQ